jgi:hypothetical protein
MTQRARTWVVDLRHYLDDETGGPGGHARAGAELRVLLQLDRRVGVGSLAGGDPSLSLERLQKRDEIGLLLRAQADVEAVVIELDHVGQRRRESVVEVRRARRKAPQNGSLEQ